MESNNISQEHREIAAGAVLSFCLLVTLLACGRTAPMDQVDCNIDYGPCTRTAGRDNAVLVTFDIGPKPVSAMKRLYFTVKATRNGEPLKDAGVSADLTMPGMRMMDNIISLKQTVPGVYVGEGVIVRCSSGKKVWRADIIIAPGEDRHQGGAPEEVAASFLFRVDR